MAKPETTANVEKEKEKEKKSQALERAISLIEKQYGKGVIMRLGSQQKVDVPVISTGSLSLDMALGVGGIPRGRVTEIFGPEASGKTTLTLHIIANAQKQGGVAAFIDAEHALDPDYAKRLGVDVKNLWIHQPDTGEQALDIAEKLVSSNGVDIIVIDSVAALTPRAEIEGEMGDLNIGLQARLMSHALRKLSGIVSKTHTSLIFINQIREKIGVMFGNPETTPGGRALKFYASVRIEIRKIGVIKEGEQALGSRVRAAVVKNKVAPPFRKAEFDIMFNHGISLAGDVLDLALENQLVEKSGTWFSYGDLRLGHGRENSKLYLEQNPKVLEELRKGILKKTPSEQPKAAASE